MLEVIKQQENTPSAMDMIFSMVTTIVQSGEIPIQFYPKMKSGDKVLTIVGPDGKLDWRFQVEIKNNIVVAGFLFQNYEYDICNPKELDELESKMKRTLNIIAIQGPNAKKD
jgi:hypothetical protein